MNDKIPIEDILKASSFLDFKWINPKDIVVSQWVRVKCEFGCTDYGLGTCPQFMIAGSFLANTKMEY